MADYKVMNNNQPAAAATSLLVSKDKEEVSPPLPVVAPVAADDDVKQTKAQRPPLAAVLVDVDVKRPPASPVAVCLPADDDNKNNRTPPPPVSDRILLTACLWALVQAFAFAVADIAILIANRTPCTKSTWPFPCVALTDAAAAEVSALLHGELWCSAAVAVAVAAPLHLLLTARTTTSRMRAWAAAVDALAWVALAATAATHYMQVASDRFYLVADPGDTYFFVDVVLASGCLAVDLLLAGFLLCCRSPRRLVPGDQQGDDGEAV